MFFNVFKFMLTVNLNCLQQKLLFQNVFQAFVSTDVTVHKMIINNYVGCMINTYSCIKSRLLSVPIIFIVS